MLAASAKRFAAEKLIKIVTTGNKLKAMDKHASASFTNARARCDSPLPLRRQPVFFFRVHFAESAVEAIGTKKRIVAEAFVATRWPHCNAVNTALELFDVPVGPGNAQRGDEMRAPLFGCFGAAFDQQCLNTVHGAAKILVGSRPARGMDAGLAAERIDHQSRIVGERRLAARARRGFRLDAGIGRESFARFFRFRQTEVAGRCVATPNGASSSRISFSLPGLWVAITTGPVSFRAHITAIFCKPTSFSMPLRASASSVGN